MKIQRYNHFAVIIVATTCLIYVSQPDLSLATITGMCSDCHTMHNSQGGDPMNLDDSAIPNQGLTRMSCYGCHAQGGPTPTVMMGSNKVPQVMHSGANHLAGGNFAYITGEAGSKADDSKGHNIADLTEPDATLYGPPGFIHGSYWVNTDRLQCAATDGAQHAGCHGRRNPTQPDYPVTGIEGNHHKNESGQLTDVKNLTTYKSYRWLHQVKGFESPDWEENATAANHNEYFATSTPLQLDCATRCHTTGGMVISRSGTISGYCATCHSNFHTLEYVPGSPKDVSDGSGIGSTINSPFIRHPSDVVIPSYGEYAAYTTYDLDAPVGRQTVPAASSSVVTPGSDAVTCLSCHMAHASDYPDMLRWEYDTTMMAGGGGSGGCFTCHSTKD